MTECDRGLNGRIRTGIGKKMSQEKWEEGGKEGEKKTLGRSLAQEKKALLVE